MASVSAEIDRKIREERDRTEREVQEIRRSSDAKIAEIRRNSEQQQRQLTERLQALERRQEEARRKMQRDVADALERQKREVQERMNRLKSDTEKALREQAEQMRREWQEAYRRLEERIRLVEARTEEILTRERDHARRSLENARERLSEAKTNVALRLFGGQSILWLTDIFNSATEEYNTGFFVPADGQAMLLMAECARCVTDAEARRKIWNRHHDEAMSLLEARTRALRAMDEPTVIEAAGYALEEVHLRVWDEDGWQRYKARLEQVRGVLEQESPCALEEIAMQMVALDQLEENIREETQRAARRVACYLYLCALLEESEAILEEEYPGLETVERVCNMVSNNAFLTLQSAENREERVTLEIREIAPGGRFRMQFEDGGYELANVRRRVLERVLRQLREAMNGEQSPLMYWGEALAYDNDPAVCVTVDAIVPDVDSRGVWTGDARAEETEEARGIGQKTPEREKEVQSE